MLIIKSSPLGRWVALAVLAGVAVGCGPKKLNLEPTKDREQISRALRVFNEYRNANNKKNPKNAEELKSWAKKNLTGKQLQDLGIENLDEALTSLRDGQPYQVVPTLPLSPGQPAGMQGVMQTVLYEKVGVEGKHMTISGMGNVTEMDDEQLKTYLANFPGSGTK
jgi:hypothetical protein